MSWTVGCRNKGNLRGNVVGRRCRFLPLVKVKSLIGQHEDARSSSK